LDFRQPHDEFWNRRKRHNYDDDRIFLAAIDLHLDGECLDSIDRSGQNTGKHVWIVCERGRKGNAVLHLFGAKPWLA
jgi:hypothetical protein